MAHDVFVSYSSNDKTVADAIVASLEQNDIRCWYAPRDIKASEDWAEAITKAIEGSKVFLIVFSGSANRSQRVLDEVNFAITEEITILPFRIENLDPVGAMKLHLSSRHWLDAYDPSWEAHLKKLVSDVSGSLETKIGEDQIRLPETVRWKNYQKKKNRKIILFSIAAVVVFTVVGWFGFRALFPPEENSIVTATQSVNEISDAELQEMSEAILPENETPVPEISETIPQEAEPVFEVIGEYRTSRPAMGLYLVESTLYLANDADNLLQMNVANPTNPLPLSVFLAYGARELVVENNVAYIITGDRNHELVMLDLVGDASYTFSNEDSPIPWSFYHIDIQSGIVHLTGHNYWGIVDLRDPMNPEELWNWEPQPNSGVPCMVKLDGMIAYIGGGWTGLHVFDISEPQQPELIGGFDTGNWIVGMELSDDVLFLSLGESGLLALDVSDPSRPLMLDQLQIPGNITDISTASNRLFVVYSIFEDYVVVESGVVAVDISDPENLEIITTYNDLRSASDVVATDDAIFVADEPWGLVVLELNP
jgi:hypothetical protein